MCKGKFLMTNPFNIITGPVRSGKTTRLSKWLSQHRQAGGFLTPDGDDGLRLLFDLQETKYHPFEVPGVSLKYSFKKEPRSYFSRIPLLDTFLKKKYPKNQNEPTNPNASIPRARSFYPSRTFSDKRPEEKKIENDFIEIGRFRFLKSTFDHGNLLLEQALTKDFDCIVVDEWGKLEKKGEGFGEACEALFNAALAGKLKAKLVVIVRDTLLDDFMAYCHDLNPNAEAAYLPKILALPD